MSDTPTYDALELNHKRFVDAILTSPSASAAYARVYECDAESARRSAARLLTNVDVQMGLDERRAQLAGRTDITAQRIIEEYGAIAFSSMRTFATWGPSGVTLVDDEFLSDADARCVSEVSETKPSEKGGGSVRIKLHDKVGALNKLAEFWAIDSEVIRKLFPDLKDDELQEGVISILRRARERQKAAQGAAR
jgi:phage terminase small subunit